MKRLLQSSTILTVITLMSFQCNRHWSKLATDFNITIEPRPIVVRNDTANFLLTISHPSRSLKKFDSLIYELVYLQGNEKYLVKKIHRDSITLGKLGNWSEQTFELKPTIHLSADSVQIYISLSAWKNGFSKTSDPIYLAEMIRGDNSR